MAYFVGHRPLILVVLICILAMGGNFALGQAGGETSPAPTPGTAAPAPSPPGAVPTPGVITPADISRALTEQNLRYTQVNETTWRLVFAGRHVNPVLGIKYTPEFVYVVVPFFNIPAQTPPGFHAQLLQLNYAMSQLKLMLDSQNLLLAGYEVPTAILTTRELVAEVKGLAADADEMYPKLRSMAGLAVEAPGEGPSPATAEPAPIPAPSPPPAPGTGPAQPTATPASAPVSEPPTSVPASSSPTVLPQASPTPSPLP